MVGGRALAVALAACGVVAASAGPAHSEPAPLILFVGPEQPSAAVAGVRTALRGVAQRRATALLDLSPKAPPRSRAPQLLRAAIDAYHGFKYDIAIDRIAKGLVEVAKTGGRGMTARSLAELFLYRALVHTARGDATASWDDFVRSAVIDPSRHLDPVRFPPRVIESFQRAVTAVRKGSTGRVSVKVPASCEVRLDGRPVKPPTQPVTMSWGDHYLSVRCPGHLAFGQRLSINSAAHAVVPALRKRTPVTVRTVAALARIRGAAQFLFAQVVGGGGATPTLNLRLIETRTLRERTRTVLRVGDSTRAADAASRIIDRAVRGDEPARVVRAKPRWYMRPWVWGLAGATITAAILVPLVVGSEPASGFDVTLGGAVP